MPDTITYSCSDSDKLKNDLSHDTLHLSNCDNYKDGVDSYISDKELSFFLSETMNCDKAAPKKLKNNDSEELIRNEQEVLVPKCNSSILRKDSAGSHSITVNGHENANSVNFGNVNKNSCKNNVNSLEGDFNLTNKDCMPDSLSQLQKSNNLNYTLMNGSDKPEENQNFKNHPSQKCSSDSLPVKEHINSKFVNHSTDSTCSDKTQAADNKSNSIHLHHKDIDLIYSKSEIAVKSKEVQNTIEKTCSNECSGKTDENVKKLESVSHTSLNSKCQKPDNLAVPLIKEAHSGDISLSQNVQKTDDFHCQVQTKSADTMCSTSSSSNFTLSHSLLSENSTETNEERYLSILEASDRGVSNECGNLKRKKQTSHDREDDDDDYKQGNTKRLKTVQENTGGTSNSNEKDIKSLSTCSKSSSTISVKQEKCMNPNELYQGLLNDVLAEDKELMKEPEVVRAKLQRIKRKDLEDMIIDQVINKMLYDHEFGYQRELCKRLEQTLEAANKRTLRLTQEIESLRNSTKKVAAEHKRRKNHLVHPTKVKRSVGIQANKSYISQGFSSAFLPDSDVKVIVPSMYQKTKKNGNSEQSKNKGKIKSEPSGDVSMNKSEEDLMGIGKTLDQKLSTLRKDILNSESKGPVKSKDKTKKLSRTHVAVNGKQLRKSGLSMTEHEQQEAESSSEPTHPAPLPHLPFDEEELLNWKVPPSPVLKVQLRNKSIILSWNITATYDESLILSYQLFSYEESKEDPPSTDLWQKIGSVKALELPMACTLTQFKCGRVYHFAVRAMTKKGRLGPFSIPKSLQMPPK